MMDAKAALTEAGGDFDKAFELLRERGLAASAKRADREASRGTHRVIPAPPGDGRVHRGDGRAGLRDRLRRQERRVPADGRRDRQAHLVGEPDLARASRTSPRSVSTRSAGGHGPQAENEGKPEHVVPRIVEGKIKQFVRQNVLYEQEFVNPAVFEGTVGEMVTQPGARMGENISVHTHRPPRGRERG